MRLDAGKMVLLVFGLLLPAACKKAQPPAATGTEEKTTPFSAAPPGGHEAKAKPPAPDDPGRELGTKLNGYISECINEFSRKASSSMQTYYSWASDKEDKPPTGKKRSIGGVNEIVGDPEECAAAVKKHNAMPPSIPALESAGTAYAEALTALVPVVNEAYRYYHQEDYKDDKMAKGKELHPKLLAAFAAFKTANRELYRVVDEQQEKLDQVALDSIEKREGKKMFWHIKRTAIVAKPLMGLNTYPDKLDQVAYKKALDVYAEAVAALEKYTEANKDEKNIDDAKLYLHGAGELLKACKDLFRRARDKERYSKLERGNLGGSSEWMVEGSPGKVVDAYNRAVDNYNRVIE